MRSDVQSVLRRYFYFFRFISTFTDVSLGYHRNYLRKASFLELDGLFFFPPRIQFTYKHMICSRAQMTAKHTCILPRSLFKTKWFHTFYSSDCQLVVPRLRKNHIIILFWCLGTEIIITSCVSFWLQVDLFSIRSIRIGGFEYFWREHLYFNKLYTVPDNFEDLSVAEKSS